MFWKRAAKAPPAEPAVHPSRRFQSMLDRTDGSSEPTPDVLAYLELTRPQFTGFKSAVDVLADMTATARQHHALGKTIAADIDAILGRGGWTRTAPTADGHTASAHCRLQLVHLDSPTEIHSPEAYGAALDTELARLAAEHGSDSRYRRSEHGYACAACPEASVIVASGRVSASTEIFEIAAVFPAGYRRAAHLTLTSSLFFLQFPTRFRTEPRPNFTLSGWTSSGGRDHTRSWVEALVMTDDGMARTKDWPNRPPAVYIGAGLEQVMM